jgi:hypothetical protein
MKISKKISVSAMLVAIACVLMAVGNFIETLTFSVAAIASLCVVIAVCELGYKYAVLSYLCISVISFFLPIKDPALYFVGFFGYYPILKSIIERIKSKIKWFLKGVVFTASYAITAFIGIKFLFEQADIIKLTLIAFPIFLAVFFIYDFALTRLITYYCRQLRSRLGVDKLLK